MAKSLTTDDGVVLNYKTATIQGAEYEFLEPVVHDGFNIQYEDGDGTAQPEWAQWCVTANLAREGIGNYEVAREIIDEATRRGVEKVLNQTDEGAVWLYTSNLNEAKKLVDTLHDLGYNRD